MEKIFVKFQSEPCFPRKMVLYLLTLICIFEPFTNIELLRKFDLCFWQTLEEVYRKLQHEEKISAKFQNQTHFPRKMVLH